jgi:hypothetical protein
MAPAYLSPFAPLGQLNSIETRLNNREPQMTVLSPVDGQRASGVDSYRCGA